LKSTATLIASLREVVAAESLAEQACFPGTPALRSGSCFVSVKQSANLEENADVDEDVRQTHQQEELAILPSRHFERDILVRPAKSQDKTTAVAHEKRQKESEDK
jgi:hypothetical protein